jgi:hypothetical protein
MEIRYSYRNAPTIKAFSEDRSFIRGLMGPFGSGKSSGCVIQMVKEAMEQAPGRDGIRRTRFAVIRNTYGQLRDTSLKTVMQWLPEHYFGKYTSQHHTYRVTGIPGIDMEIMFCALDRPDDVKKLLSLELTSAWINEAREIPRAIFEAVQGRVGRYPSAIDGGATRFGVFMDTNPPDVDHWWYKTFEEKRPDNARLFKQPSGLSPNAENANNLPAGYYFNLMKDKDEEWVKVYVKGDYGFVIEGKPVYPEYNDAIHCGNIEPIRGLPFYRGWDFGLTPAITLSQFPAGRWLVHDELNATSMGTTRFGKEVIPFCSKYAGFEFIDIGDPAGAQRAQTDERTSFEILAAMGIEIQPGDQDPNIRQECVRAALNTMVDGKPGFMLNPRCKMLRKGFQGGYQLRRLQTSSERYTSVPDKNAYSHPHDSLQYVGTRLYAAALKTKAGVAAAARPASINTTSAGNGMYL